MDEPTATLTPPGGRAAVRRDPRAEDPGPGDHLHHPPAREIFAIADRVMVLRDGAARGHAARRPSCTRDDVIEMMVGRRLDQEFPDAARRDRPSRACVVRDLRRGEAVRDVSFAVRRGEIVGLTGLVGSGRTETARLIFGADRPDAGTIELDGRTLAVRGPRDAIRRRICLLTEDRKTQGLVLERSVRENFALPNLGRLSRLGLVNHRRERETLGRYVSSPADQDPARGAARTQPLRRQPAEGRAGQVAGGPLRRAHLRRADAGHRRGGQVRDLPAHQRAGRRRARRS